MIYVLIKVEKNSKIVTYGDNGDKIINSLKQNASKDLHDQALIVTKILLDNKKWISDTIDMRDEVTHFLDLQVFCCFIQHVWTGRELQTSLILQCHTGDGLLHI